MHGTFLQEECEDLQQMVENGLLKKPTVVSSLMRKFCFFLRRLEFERF